MIDHSAVDAILRGEDDAFAITGRGGFNGTAGELRYESGRGDTMVSSWLWKPSDFHPNPEP